MSQLLTAADRAALLANGARRRRDPNFDPAPVVKLFTPDAAATWLLTEIDPADRDLAYGLCDLGLGSPELGTVSLAEIGRLRGPLGLPVERDRVFRARGGVAQYAHAARRLGRIEA